MGQRQSTPVSIPAPCNRTWYNFRWWWWNTQNRVQQNLAYPDLREKVRQLTEEEQMWISKYNLCDSERTHMRDTITGLNGEITTLHGEIGSLHYQDVIKAYKYDDKIIQQNEELDREINLLKELYSTDDQKVLYETQQIDFLANINFYLWWIYWALVFFLFATLLLLSSSSITMKVVIIILAVLYPFTIYYIEKVLYFIYMYLVSIIKGKAFVSSYS